VTLEAERLDICRCGDYRHQHDATGCVLCRAQIFPWDGCTRFRLHLTASVTWRP
jgi:hypothetical protein